MAEDLIFILFIKYIYIFIWLLGWGWSPRFVTGPASISLLSGSGIVDSGVYWKQRGYKF
jgi:hypothetical protein